MTTVTTPSSLALVPSLETAWQDVDSSFERFCLTAGIGAMERMLCEDAQQLAGEPHSRGGLRPRCHSCHCRGQRCGRCRGNHQIVPLFRTRAAVGSASANLRARTATRKAENDAAPVKMLRLLQPWRARFFLPLAEQLRVCHDHTAALVALVHEVVQDCIERTLGLEQPRQDDRILDGDARAAGQVRRGRMCGVPDDDDPATMPRRLQHH